MRINKSAENETHRKDKRFLFDICHPAHFHLFKHVIVRLTEAGNHVIIAARDKDVTVDLLNNSGFPFNVISKVRQTRIGMLIELIQRDLEILRLMRQERIGIAVGTSVSISRLSRLCSAQSVIFNEDDAEYIPLFTILAYPFAHVICTPEGVSTGRWKQKQLTYPGYHELAYLHPNLFTPDPGIYKKIGLNPEDSYCLIRLSAFKAHHDPGEKGLTETQINRLIKLMEQYGRVFVSNERRLPNWLEKYRIAVPPDKIHDVLAGATCLVSDSQTMTMEASVLGVPAFRCNSFVGRCSVINELEQNYKLAYGFKPDQFDQLLQCIRTLKERADLKKEWTSRRDRMLGEKINVADWMFNFLHSF